MKKVWDWFNGNKTYIAVILSVVISVLGRRGVEIPLWVYDVTDGILGLGLAHKAVKAVGPAIAGKAAALLAFLGLTAACTTSPQSQPQIPLAPVYQAGSPVTLTINLKSDSAKTSTTRQGSDARGDVGASGEQENEPSVDVTPTVSPAVGDSAIEAIKPITPIKPTK